MPTVTHTFTFTSDTEDIADVSSTNMTFSRDSTDAAIKFVCNVDTIAASSDVRVTTATKTWEDYGVPAGATVTHIQISAWKRKLVSNGNLTSHQLQMYVYNNAGTSTVHSGTLLDTGVLFSTTTDGSYTSQTAGSTIAVDMGGNDASDTYVRFAILYETNNVSGSASNIDLRLDDVSLVITYDDASQGGVRQPPIFSLLGLGAVAGTAASNQFQFFGHGGIY